MKHAWVRRGWAITQLQSQPFSKTGHKTTLFLPQISEAQSNDQEEGQGQRENRESSETKEFCGA